MLRRQKHALSQSTTPFACTLITPPNAQRNHWGMFASEIVSQAGTNDDIFSIKAPKDS